MIVETEAVVLHTLNYRDTSKIVTLYTRKFGKVKVVAKGTRNQKTNKFGSSLEPMTYSSVVFYKKERNDLHLLSKSEIVTPLSRLQGDPEKMFSGLAIIELIRMVMHDEEEHEQLFNRIVEALKTIDGAVNNAPNALMGLILRIFQEFGFGITLSSCSVCGRNTGENDFAQVVLRLSDGKMKCPLCEDDLSFGGVKVSGGVIKSLYYLQMNSIEKSVTLNVQQPVREEMFAVVQAYLRYHIEGARTLKSLSMLHTMTMK